jgi:hypothetical protein
MKNNFTQLKPIFLIFCFTSAAIFLFANFLTNKQVNLNILFAANILFMLLHVLVFMLQKKAWHNANPNVFVRSVISGLMIKMFSTALAVVAYVIIVKNYSSATIFLGLFLYLFYLAAEVFSILRITKNG